VYISLAISVVIVFGVVLDIAGLADGVQFSLFELFQGRLASAIRL
jgi:hypothetical protein